MTIGKRNVVGMTSLSSPLSDPLYLKSVTEASSRADKKRGGRIRKIIGSFLGNSRDLGEKLEWNPLKNLTSRERKEIGKGVLQRLYQFTLCQCKVLTMQGIANARYCQCKVLSMQGIVNARN